MPLLDSDLLAEIDPAGLADRRAWFALRLRPRPRPRADASANGVRLVLAIDRSSSMQGEKFEQARIAALVLLKQLGDDDAVRTVCHRPAAPGIAATAEPKSRLPRARSATREELTRTAMVPSTKAAHALTARVKRAGSRRSARVLLAVRRPASAAYGVQA